MFVGRFEHSLDDKGRLVLPSSYRQQFAERGFLTQYQRCLGLWTADGFDDVTERLREKFREGSAPNSALRAFASNAVEVKVDKQGRISIPEWLRKKSDLERDAVIIGVLDRVEIWSADRWQQEADGADAELLRAVDELGI
ncbi:MAG: division/cell wall cluster transcriptional repressor MraZ [Actinobacteria bacterium]|nr:division/cell wall cluster transcriptional repressor MraZ [Actinomycetota bacterium]